MGLQVTTGLGSAPQSGVSVITVAYQPPVLPRVLLETGMVF
jgi:hypothetical protein